MELKEKTKKVVREIFEMYADSNGIEVGLKKTIGVFQEAIDAKKNNNFMSEEKKQTMIKKLELKIEYAKKLAQGGPF